MGEERDIYAGDYAAAGFRAHFECLRCGDVTMMLVLLEECLQRDELGNAKPQAS